MVLQPQEYTKILANLIAIKSVNDNELEVANYLKDFFKKNGINSKVIPIRGKRANLVAEIGQGSPVLAVSGHMDVVDPGSLKSWDSDPFTLTEKDGKLFGRGITDMKSGLAALAIAMVKLKERGLPRQGTVRLLATMGEEVGEEGSAEFYNDGYMKNADGLLIAEPSTIYGTTSAQKGSYDIKLTSLGKSVHSSVPEKGYNALVPLIKLLNEANDYFETVTSGKMGSAKFNIDVLSGGKQVNSLPDSAQALVNIRTIPEYNNDQVTKKINELVNYYNENGAKISLEVIMNESPIATSSENTLVKLIKTIGKEYTGTDIIVAASPGITDASNLAKDKPDNFPFAVYGPGDGTQHQVNESLPKKMYLDFIEIYQKLFIDFLEKRTF